MGSRHLGEAGNDDNDSASLDRLECLALHMEKDDRGLERWSRGTGARILGAKRFAKTAKIAVATGCIW